MDMPWFEPWWYDAAQAPSQPPELNVPLAERRISGFDPTVIDASPGRRLRVLATIVRSIDPGTGVIAMRGSSEQYTLSRMPETYGRLLEAVESEPEDSPLRSRLAALPLRTVADGPLLRAIPEGGVPARRDPDLHPALQDLGDEINEDIREALGALDDPGHYYPGIDDGIEPVTDEHVELVVWALQRELNRELRPSATAAGRGAPLPAAPLIDLPWPVKRAIAERRRWRYRQWGIGREQWSAGAWSFWDVPCDPAYTPRRSARLAAVG